jgi:1,4-dihydroxy-2-naphthoate octaprenyltransferase
MPSDTARPVDPSPAEFAGELPGQVAKRLFHATRPKFFPASVLPVLAGTAWGVQIAGQFDAVLFLLALIATVSVHAGANVLNDVGDESGGTDRQNTDRIYPYTGGSRFIQTGILEARSMARLGISLLTVAPRTTRIHRHGRTGRRRWPWRNPGCGVRLAAKWRDR